MKVGGKFKLSKKTLFITYQLIDCFTQSLGPISNQEYHLIGVTSLFMASKWEEIHHPKISQLTFVCNHIFTAQHIVACEERMLVFFKFDLSLVTVIDFLDLFKSVLGFQESEYLQAVDNAYQNLFESCQFSDKLH